MGNLDVVGSAMPVPQLGRYQLVRQLAIGGMAEVYLGRASGPEGFQKLVVLKRILPQFAADPSYVGMFLDEARLAARLQHPNIVQVFDVGVDAGVTFIAMEYAHGQDVRAILSAAARSGRPIPLGVALGIVQAVARGLHFAHDACDEDGVPLGVVHRDVSPANVIVTFDGSVKLLDFGVAKARSHTRQTQSGTLKGKIGYMSPEQCLGDALDRRSDVFALGILLYELTTGSRLFHDDAEFRMLMRIVHEDAPCPADRREGYPAQLAAIVRRALARDRDLRYASARDLERDLAAFARAAGLDDASPAAAELLAELFPDGPTEPRVPLRALGTGPFDVGEDPSIVVVEASEPPPARRARIGLAVALAAVVLLGLLGLGAAGLGLGPLAPRRATAHLLASSPPAATPTPPIQGAAAAPLRAAGGELAPSVAPEPPAPAAEAPGAPDRAVAHAHHRRASHRAARAADSGKMSTWDPDSALLPSL